MSKVPSQSQNSSQNSNRVLIKATLLWQAENMKLELAAISLGHIIRVLRWATEEVGVLMADVRNELKDTKSILVGQCKFSTSKH